MSLITLSDQHIGDIEKIFSLHVPGLSPRFIRRSIESLEAPILEYVSKYVPKEYDSSFEYMDTWDSMLEDILRRGSPRVPRYPNGSVRFEVSDVVTPLKKVVEELPIEESLPVYLGPWRYAHSVGMTFQKRVAMVLLVLLMLHFLTADSTAAEIATEFVVGEQKSFVQKVLTKYVERREEENQKKEEAEMLRF